MVTIKGTRISNKHAKRDIRGMKKLIYAYQHRIEELDECPICKDCDTCPWTILTGGDCNRNYYWQIVQSPRRRANRKKQLRRWIKIYEGALEKEYYTYLRQLIKSGEVKENNNIIIVEIDDLFQILRVDMMPIHHLWFDAFVGMEDGSFEWTYSEAFKEMGWSRKKGALAK